jgi:hypothetical protein
LGSRRHHCGNSNRWMDHRMVVFTSRSCLTLSLIGLIGCTTLKKAAIVSTLGTTGALVGSAVSGTAGLVVGGLTTAAVADVATEVMVGSTSSSDMNSCAPDNFWSLLGSLVEMGGWLLILVFVAPMILGWILPGPLEKKKKDSAS